MTPHFKRGATDEEKAAVITLLTDGKPQPGQLKRAIATLVPDAEFRFETDLGDMREVLARTRAAFSSVINGVYTAVIGQPGIPLDRDYVIELVEATVAREKEMRDALLDIEWKGDCARCPACGIDSQYVDDEIDNDYRRGPEFHKQGCIYTKIRRGP